MDKNKIISNYGYTKNYWRPSSTIPSPVSRNPQVSSSFVEEEGSYPIHPAAVNNTSSWILCWHFTLTAYQFNSFAKGDVRLYSVCENNSSEKTGRLQL